MEIGSIRRPYKKGAEMKNSFTVNMPKPCAQSWEQMDQTANGKFCTHCSTEVVDFSHMTIAQLQAYFQTTSTKVCGRIDPFQLQQLNQSLSTKPTAGGFRFPLIVASIFTLLTTGKAAARPMAPIVKPNVQFNQYLQTENVAGVENSAKQTFVIKGSVKTKEGSVLIAGALVTIPTLKLRAVTDAKGQFQFSITGTAKQTITLVVTHLSFESQQVIVVLGETQKPLILSLATDKSLMMGEVVIMPAPIKHHRLTLDTPKTIVPKAMLVGGMIAARKTRPSFFSRLLNDIGSWLK